MKIRTLLFGAGPGALVYMENTAEQREFIGFLDNDQAKHGKHYQGLLIYPPASINTLQFDQVVITTQWALAVQKQLLDELGVPTAKVLLPEKNKLKKITPFAHPEGMALGRQIVKKISALALDIGIPLVADFGTLLGLVRDKDIIQWDDDIDFSIKDGYALEVERLLMRFVDESSTGLKWRIFKAKNGQGEITGMWLKFTDPRQQLIEFTTSLCFREVSDDLSLHMPSLGMWFSPRKHFDSVEYINWQDCTIPVPCDYANYLNFQYGDWQVPKKDIQLSDYANLRDVEFNDIKAANHSAEAILEQH